MKIGVSSYSYQQYMDRTGADYFQICDLAKQAGFDGIEFIDLDTKRQPMGSQEELAKAIKAHCDSISLPIFAYTVAADFLQKENEIERLKRQVDIAHILGAPLMRHDVTWISYKDADWREVIGNLAQPIREVTQYAAGKGIRTCTENHGLFLQDSDRIEALIRAVGHSNFGWLVDVGNFLCVDELAIHALPIALPYAFHIHIKDFLQKAADADNPGDGWFLSRHGTYLRGTVVGHGAVPIAKCMDLIMQSGYNGTISIEFEGMEEAVTAVNCGLAFLRKFV